MVDISKDRNIWECALGSTEFDSTRQEQSSDVIIICEIRNLTLHLYDNSFHWIETSACGL